MAQLFPKKNPEAAKKLLETPDEKLTNVERDKKFALAIATTPMPCPMCFVKMSVIDAADDTLEVGGGDYNGTYVCPNCETELAKVVPFFMVPGTPGWHWQRKHPVPGKKMDNDRRNVSLQELEVLVAEHDTVTLLVTRAQRRIDLGVHIVVPEQLQLVTSVRLSAYLQAHGWTIDEAGSDDKHRTWRKSDGRVCYTHAEGDAEVMAGDVESVALSEGCSMLRVLVGLLALGPLT
ncbi:hypothetical protein [Polyangium aurulentum]|uniref:hypothetical protein n=1 Tax=Polyangium aurulentum TaxID=2567896 RepID=UPI0010AEBB97|nr:hypothetical protein [Polyangium aurulentum]UQA61415.1 hypothetical protein E8A73_013445 [Polyangium aurulentum]